MDEILHHFETIGNHCLLVSTGESSFEVLLAGAGFRASTVLLLIRGLILLGCPPKPAFFYKKLFEGGVPLFWVQSPWKKVLEKGSPRPGNVPAWSLYDPVKIGP